MELILIERLINGTIINTLTLSSLIKDIPYSRNTMCAKKLCLYVCITDGNFKQELGVI